MTVTLCYWTWPSRNDVSLPSNSMVIAWWCSNIFHMVFGMYPTLIHPESEMVAMMRKKIPKSIPGLSGPPKNRTTGKALRCQSGWLPFGSCSPCSASGFNRLESSSWLLHFLGRLCVPAFKSSSRWFGTFFCSIFWDFHHPNWLIFFRGVETTNQWNNV